MNLATIADRVEHDSPDVNIMPPTVFYACLILGGFLEFLFPHDFPVLSRPVRIVLGSGLGAAGFAFMGIALEQFKGTGTHIPTNLPATTFGVQGGYRFCHNPMYVGGTAFF